MIFERLKYKLSKYKITRECLLARPKTILFFYQNDINR